MQGGRHTGRRPLADEGPQDIWNATAIDEGAGSSAIGKDLSGPHWVRSRRRCAPRALCTAIDKINVVRIERGYNRRVVQWVKGRWPPLTREGGGVLEGN
jgi:hypothetical protein